MTSDSSETVNIAAERATQAVQGLENTIIGPSQVIGDRCSEEHESGQQCQKVTGHEGKHAAVLYQEFDGFPNAGLCLWDEDVEMWNSMNVVLTAQADRMEGTQR